MSRSHFDHVIQYYLYVCETRVDLVDSVCMYSVRIGLSHGSIDSCIHPLSTEIGGEKIVVPFFIQNLRGCFSGSQSGKLILKSSAWLLYSLMSCTSLCGQMVINCLNGEMKIKQLKESFLTFFFLSFLKKASARRKHGSCIVRVGGHPPSTHIMAVDQYLVQYKCFKIEALFNKKSKKNVN